MTQEANAGTVQQANTGIASIGFAKDVNCPVCFVLATHGCVDSKGNYRAPHVERGRTARWVSMFNL